MTIPWVQASLKEKGIDEVIVYCVDNGAVMDAWADDQALLVLQPTQDRISWHSQC